MPFGATLHRSRSFWFDQAEPYHASEPLRGEQVSDICVIGGGINGISTAYHLRQQDASCNVALLEAEVVGFGASGRNAGQLIVTFGGTNFEANLRRFGAARMGEGWRYVAQGLERIEQFMARDGTSCDYTNTGFIEVSLIHESPALFNRYRNFVEAIGQSGLLQPLSADQMAAGFDSPYLGAGLYDSRGGQLDPLKLIRRLKAAAERLGASVYENSPVAHIDVSGSRIRVSTGAGTITCSKLVLATNAYTHLLDGLQSISASALQRPMIIHAGVTEPLPLDRWEAVGWVQRCGVNVLSKLFYSFGPTIDGRLVYVGGYHANMPKGRDMGQEINPGFIADGHRHLEQFFPAFRGIRTTQSWGGPISITYNAIPHIGAARDPRILYACGCWGHGMPLGMENGVTLAALALDRGSEHSETWFVRSPKAHWPNRVLVDLAAEPIVAMHRRNYRRLGAAMVPPLRFERYRA